MKTKLYLLTSLLFIMFSLSFTSCDEKNHINVVEELKVDQNNFVFPCDGDTVDVHVLSDAEIAFQGKYFKPSHDYYNKITDNCLECSWYKAEIDGRTIHLIVYPNDTAETRDGMLFFGNPKEQARGTIYFTQEGKK